MNLPSERAHARPGAEITAGRRGQATVRVIGEDGRETYLHSLYDPDQEALAHVPEEVRRETLVFLGTGLGYHLPRTLAGRARVKRVVLVEHYPELAQAAAAKIRDSGVRIDIVSGSAATDSSAGAAIPLGLDCLSLQIIPHPPSLNANPAWYAGWQAVFATIGQSTPLKPIPDPAGNVPLTILVLYGAYYGQQECIRGFQALGHRVVTIDYRDREGETITTFQKTVLEERVDLVFSVNMRGLDSSGVMGAMLGRLGIPLALWFVDSPDFIFYGEALPPPEATLVYLWDRSYLPRIEKLGYRARYLPLAADPALAGAAQPTERFRARVSFVGNSLLSGFLSRLTVKIPQDHATKQLMEQAVTAVLAGRGRQLETLEALTAAGGSHFTRPDEALFFQAYALHSATSVYRTSLLERLLPLELVFFGDPDGWRTLFGERAAALPDVNYFAETPAVYASTEVNFNATSLQMPLAVNQRVFDVPLCGGFLLTDRQDALFELFAEDELAVYGGVEDVAEQAAGYLRAPALRREIMARARSRVLGEHTYRHRMGELLRDVSAG